MREVAVVIIPFPGRAAAPQPAEAPAPLADVVALFLVDLQVEGRAARTLGGHLHELRRYGRWLMEQDRTWRDVIEDDLVAYIRTRAHLGPSSRRAATTSLRRFYAWTVRRHLITVSPAAGLDTPARPQPTPNVLTKAQVRAIVAYLAAQEGERARRDECLVLLGIYTGQRASELANLRWSEVDLDAGTITISLSKMNHGRVLAIHPDVIALLRRWRVVTCPREADPVFPDMRGKRRNVPIVPSRAGKIVHAIAVATGIPVHTHKLRHTFATWTLKESKDLYAVSKALGHKALKQTEIYVAAAADVEQIAEAVAHLPGLGAW
jgi:integrase